MMKYLYIPKLPEDEELFHEVCSQFLKKAFCSEATLVICVDTMKDFNVYVEWYQGKAKGIGGFRGEDDYLTKLGAGGYPVCGIRLKELPYGEPNYEKMIADVDCYIAGSSHEKEFYCIEKSYDLKKDIVSSFLPDIFADMPQIEEKIKIKEEISKEVEKLLDEYPPEEYEWILFHQGLTETATLFYMMKEYKTKINKKLLFLCYDESRKSLLEESPYIDVCITIPSELYAYISIFLSDKYHIKNFVLQAKQNLGVKEHLLPPAKSKFSPNIFLARLMLGFDDDYKFEKYPVEISDTKRKTAENLFREMNLKKGYNAPRNLDKKMTKIS